MDDSAIYNKQVYLGQLSETTRTDYGKRDFASQCDEQKIFSAIWELESELGNGGFQGYFGNGAELADFAPGALRAIGAPRCAAIIEEALALVPPSLPTDLDSRWEVLHAEPVMTQFESLGKRYFAAPEKVIALLYRFVTAHPDVFGPAPEDLSAFAPPPEPTPAERDAMLRSLMDSLQGGPEALLRIAGTGVPLEELDPETQRLTTNLASELNRIVTEFQQGKAVPPPPPTPAERDGMLRSLKNIQQGGREATLSELSRTVKASQQKAPEDTPGGDGDDEHDGKS